MKNNPQGCQYISWPVLLSSFQPRPAAESQGRFRSAPPWAGRTPQWTDPWSCRRTSRWPSSFFSSGCLLVWLWVLRRSPGSASRPSPSLRGREQQLYRQSMQIIYQQINCYTLIERQIFEISAIYMWKHWSMASDPLGFRSSAINSTDFLICFFCNRCTLC